MTDKELEQTLAPFFNVTRPDEANIAKAALANLGSKKSKSSKPLSAEEKLKQDKLKRVTAMLKKQGIDL